MRALISDSPESPTESTSPARSPRLLLGIGAFAAVTAACEFVARSVPRAGGAVLFGAAWLFGMFWLAFITLRVGELSADPNALSAVDRFLIRWSGPIAVLLLPVTATFAMMNIEDRRGITLFTSNWSQHLVELSLASGFVLALGCVMARGRFLIPPRWLWKLACTPWFWFTEPIHC